MAAKSSSRGGRTVRLIAVHTNEGDNPAFEAQDRRAENLARWMDDQPVSYHKVVDDDSVVNYVPDHLMAWSLRSGNPISLNVCLIGRAAWSREEWLRHDQMLQMAALVVKSWGEVHKIPLAKLSPSQVAASLPGVIGHVDWTRGMRDGSHTDPGDQFPWDVFMRYALGTFNQDPGGDDMATVPQAEWDEIRGMVRTLYGQMMGPWPSYRYNVPPGDKNAFSVVDFLREGDREENSWFDLTGRPGGSRDRVVGHILSTRAEVLLGNSELRAAAQKWDEFMARKA